MATLGTSTPLPGKDAGTSGTTRRSAPPASGEMRPKASARGPSSSSRRKKEASPPRLWTADFVLGTLTNFVLSCNYFMLTVVMTEYALNVYAAPASAAAFTASIFIIGTLVARLATNVFASKVSYKALLVIGALAEIVFTALYILEVPLGVLMALRLLHGFAYGICATTLATVITTIVPAARKGEGIGYYMLSVTLGAAIGPFAGILLSRHVGYEVLFVIAAAVVVASLPLIAFMRAISCRRSAASAADEIAGAVTGSPEENAREDAAAARDAGGNTQAQRAKGTRENTLCGKGKRPGTEQSWARRYLEPSVIPISLTCCLIFFGYSSLLTFLTPYAIEIGLARAASVFFIVYAISMFITRPITGRSFDRRGPRPVMIPAFFTFSAGMIVLAFASNDWMILGAALLLGFGVGTIQSCGLAMAVKHTPISRLGMANATFYIMLDIGTGLGPLVLGTIVPLTGYTIMYVLMGCVGLAAFVMFLFVSRKKA